MSNAVFEYLDARTRIDFPLVGRGATPAGLYELLVDAYVIHNSGVQQNVQITNLDPAGDLTLRFADTTLLATLSAADGFQSQTWGEWTLLQWQRASVTATDLTDEEIVARLVLRTSKLADFVFPIAPVGATLQPSVVVNRIDRVRRFLLALPNTSLAMYHDPTAPDVMDGEVRLDAGNNMQIDVATEDVPSGLQLPVEPVTRPKTRITFNAVPGAGEGLYNACGDPSPIKKINGVGPDNAGNFGLEALDCYWLEHPLSGVRTAPVKPGTDYHGILLGAPVILDPVETVTAITTLTDRKRVTTSSNIYDVPLAANILLHIGDVVTAGTVVANISNILQIHNNCTACCSCASYGAAYEELVQVWNRAKAAAARIEHSRERYNELRDYLATVKTEREVGLRVFLQAVPRPDFSISVAAVVTNNAATDVTTAINIITSFTYAPNIVVSEYLERSGRLDIEEAHNTQVDPIIAGETYTITIPYLRAAHYARYSFDIRCVKPVPNPILRQDVTVKVVTQAAYGLNSAYGTAFAKLAKPVEKE